MKWEDSQKTLVSKKRTKLQDQDNVSKKRTKLQDNPVLHATCIERKKRRPLFLGQNKHLTKTRILKKEINEKRQYFAFSLASTDAKKIYKAWNSCKTLISHSEKSNSLLKVLKFLDDKLLKDYSVDEIIEAIKTFDWMRLDGIKTARRFNIPTRDHFSILDFFFVNKYIPVKYRSERAPFFIIIALGKTGLALGTEEEAKVVKEIIHMYRNNVLGEKDAKINFTQTSMFYDAARKLLSYMKRTKRLDRYLTGKKIDTWDYVHHAFLALSERGLMFVTPKNLASDWLWDDRLPKYLSKTYGG
jgi:hypothetical protein